MSDQTQWTTGQQFTVVEMRPPPAGRTFVLYQVILMPRDEPEAQVCLWCETRTAGAAPLRAQDVVAVKGKTLSSVLVERLVQGMPDGSQYLLVMPSYDTDFDAWAQQQAEALRAKNGDQLDIEHLAAGRALLAGGDPMKTATALAVLGALYHAGGSRAITRYDEAFKRYQTDIITPPRGDKPPRGWPDR